MIKSTTLVDAVSASLLGALFALPDSALRALAGPMPREAEGLEVEAWMVARLWDRAGAAAGELPPAQMRARFDRIVLPFSLSSEVPVSVEDHLLAGPAAQLRARLYVPEAAAAPGPLLVYFHGGGWVRGSIATHEAPCKLLARLAETRILSVEYRLAPEHPFPAAADDALAAYAQAAERCSEFGADPERLAVGGDSAGGNLAAVTAQAARDHQSLPPPAFQLLLYPAVDMSRRYRSRSMFGERFLLTDQSIAWYEDQYVPDPAGRVDPRASPLLAQDLAGVAPAYIATCLADPLRDEGEEYARQLRKAGVRVALQRHPQVHGFFSHTITRAARRAVAVVAGALRQGLA